MDACLECGALVGQEHHVGCDMVLHGEVAYGAVVLQRDCEEKD